MLFGTPPLPFSVTMEFPAFGGPTSPVRSRWRGIGGYRKLGEGDRVRHRARFYPRDASRCASSSSIVGRFDGTEVLVDDRPVPYARELWLPLIWFLIR